MRSVWLVEGVDESGNPVSHVWGFEGNVTADQVQDIADETFWTTTKVLDLGVNA